MAAGTYQFTNSLNLASKNNITVKGAGAAQTILDFKGQAAGADGRIQRKRDDPASAEPGRSQRRAYEHRDGDARLHAGTRGDEDGPPRLAKDDAGVEQAERLTGQADWRSVSTCQPHAFMK